MGSVGAWTLLALGWLAVEVPQTDGRDILEALTAVDQVYLASLTIAGRERTAVEFMRPGDPGGMFEWCFTRSGEVLALHRRLVELNPIVFLSDGDSVFLDHDDSGNFITNVLVDEKLHFSPQERFHVQRYDRCVISPTGDMLERLPCDVVSYYAPDDNEAALPIYRVLWSMGRGYSPHFEQLLESEPLPEGRVSLKVSGFTALPTRGIWSLVVDPARSYLVTKAEFVREGRTTPTVVIDNQHLVGEPPCEVAESAGWTVDVGQKWSTDVACESARFGVDQELLALCERAKLGPFPPGSLGNDKRSGKAIALDLRPPKRPVVDVEPITRTSNTMKMSWLIGLHLVAGILGYMWFVHYRAPRDEITHGRPS